MTKWIGRTLGAGALILILSSAAAGTPDEDFEKGVMSRLDRIEKLLKEDHGIRSAVEFICDAEGNQCNVDALHSCQAGGFTRGVASKRTAHEGYSFVTVTEITCT